MSLDIEIHGVGRTRSAEKWNLGLVDLAVKAGGLALDDASNHTPTAIVVGNALGGALDDQRNLAVYVASRLGLDNTEAHSVSCDEASGGAALRLAISLIQSGFHESVLVIGAEKTSDALPDQLEAVRATALDAMREAEFGFGPAIGSALGMQRYLAEYELDRDMFFYLAQTAHLHGAKNPLAIFSWPLTMAQYQKSPTVASPLSVCDNAPACDGGAAVLIGKGTLAGSNVKILGSSCRVSKEGIAVPITDLSLASSTHSANEALKQSGLTLENMDLFELHDSSAFFAALSIESLGLAKPGEALKCAQNGDFQFDGRAPMWTFGGHKSRGHAPGAGGLYQVVEAALQLRGDAQQNQLSKANTALVQCLGSFGAQAVTHILG